MPTSALLTMVEPRRKEARCTAGGTVRRNGRRADPHLGPQHAPAGRDGSDPGCGPQRLRWWLALLRVIFQLAAADTPAREDRVGRFGGK
jgi:hypothetical protein